MSEPWLTREHGAFRFEWGDPERAILEFDLIRAERSGDVTAEIEVTSTAPAIGGLVHHARVNLVGTRSRQELAGHLAKRTNGVGTDWPTLVEIACRETLRAFRAGAPAIRLRDAVEPEGGEYALGELLLARLPVLLFGDARDGQVVARPRARVVPRDRPSAPWAAPVRAAPGRIPRLGVRRLGAPETSSGTARLGVGSRLRSVRQTTIRGRRPHPPDHPSVRPDLPRPRLGCFACDGPPEAAEVAGRFFQALRELGLGSLLIAHVNRSGDTDRPFGSTFWHNGARATWYAKRETEAGSNVVDVGLFNAKANTGPLSTPLGFHIEFNDDATRITRTDVRTVANLATAAPLTYRIRGGVLGLGPRTIASLAAELEPDEDDPKFVDTVGRTLRRMRGQGKAHDVTGADGVTRWVLTKIEAVA